MNRNIAKQFTATLSLLDVASGKTNRYKCFHGEDVQLTVNVVGENQRPVDLSNASVKIYFTLDKNINEPVYRQDTGIVVDNLGVITVMLEKSYIRIGNNVLKIVLYDEDQTVFLQPLIISCIDPLIGEAPDLEIPDDINVRDEIYDIRRIIGDLQDFDVLGREIIEARDEYGTVGRRLDNFDSQLDIKANEAEVRNLQQQVNNLVLGAVGDGNNAEVIQARDNEKLLFERLNKIESGKRINSISFSKFNKRNVDIIDYNKVQYDTMIVGYNTTTLTPTYKPKNGSCVAEIEIDVYSGTMIIPKYEAEGQALLFSANDAVFKNLTPDDLENNDHIWVTKHTNHYEISMVEIWKYSKEIFNKTIDKIIVAFDMNNTFCYRKNGVDINNNECLVEEVNNVYPFDPKSTLIKDKRNYRCMIKAIKDIKIYTPDLTHRFYVRHLVYSENTVGVHIGTVEKGDTVLNIPKIEVKSGNQKINFLEQSSSGYSGYIIIDTSLIDPDIYVWNWKELDYQTSALSPKCLDVYDLDKFNDRLINVETRGGLNLVIPPKIYGVSNKEIALYLDNITTTNLDNYIFRKVSGTGDLKSRNRIIYNTDTTGWADKTKLEIYNNNGNKIKDLEIPFKIVSKTANNGITKKCIFIGDSFIANGNITSELVRLFNNDVMNVELLGTRGSGTNKHEGRSGWSSYDYVATSSFNNFTNGFLNNGIFDFGYYINQNSIDVPDYVFIQVGINDIWRPMNGTTTIKNLQTMINSIKAFNSNIKVGIALVCPPYLGEYGVNNKYNHLKRIKLNETIIDAFSNKESENVFIVPINVNLDTIYNFTIGTTVINSRNNNTISDCTDTTHPANSGYYQIADSYYCFLKCN